MAFFEKYEEESSGVDFSVDLGKLLGVLGGRIRKEEMILYKKYDELTAAK